jgi:nitroimidazol reductase NimA-like FMN-containing flavoprotein (pyridoxamine 5'-phosphate oxidase superfamily)
MTDKDEANQSHAANIETLLSEPLLARIATVSVHDLQPHVVPVWFLWDGESVWISSYSSTRKIRELQCNPKCSIVIDAANRAGGLSAVLFEGQAELVTEPREFVQEMVTRVYAKYLGPEGVLAADPQEWIYSPENLLIKLTPEKTVTW